MRCSRTTDPLRTADWIARTHHHRSRSVPVAGCAVVDDEHSGASMVQLLAREGHGAVQVDEAVTLPVIAFLAGPIKHWWSLSAADWGTGAHLAYTTWRDAVEVALVRTGAVATYSPHKAIRGAWHEGLQAINDAAIRAADVVLDLTPPGVPAVGTAAERTVADAAGVPVLAAPPGDDAALERLVEEVLTHRRAPAD